MWNGEFSVKMLEMPNFQWKCVKCRILSQNAILLLKFDATRVWPLTAAYILLSCLNESNLLNADFSVNCMKWWIFRQIVSNYEFLVKMREMVNLQSKDNLAFEIWRKERLASDSGLYFVSCFNEWNSLNVECSVKMCKMVNFQSKCVKLWIFSQNVCNGEFSVKMWEMGNFQS